MHITKRSLASAIATGALLFNSFATAAYAGTTLQISGNGSDSTSNATLNKIKTNTVVQANTAKITNNVDVDADTGGNDANDNTGGDVSIDTGAATVKVGVLNDANKNSASLDCCNDGDTSVKIAGNGSDSDNNATLDMLSANSIFQTNDAGVTNNVDVDADTGDNDAEDNTGGDVSVKTGSAKVLVDVESMLNRNLARIGGNGSSNNSLSLWILGNGSDSDNSVDLTDTSLNLVAQSNDADVTNNVDVDAETGDNDANDNTGGTVSIDTGKVEAKVGVKNLANFNWADLSCGCLVDDLLAKVADNGSDSSNDITADLTNLNDMFQGNGASLNNNLDEIEGDTGDNDANDNTADGGGDPSVDTGDASLEVGAVNAVNTNSVNQGGSLAGLDFDFDLGSLWLLLLGL